VHSGAEQQAYERQQRTVNGTAEEAGTLKSVEVRQGRHENDERRSEDADRSDHRAGDTGELISDEGSRNGRSVRA